MQDLHKSGQDIRSIGLIFLVSFSLLFLLIANPGYWSHDELQRYDYFLANGFEAYLNKHLQLDPGEYFAVPVRPVAFLIQGILNFFLRDYPVIVHLFAVLVHASSASLLLIICRRFGLSARVSRTAALVFLVNPMTILATGWSAALMDQWYFLFLLLMMIATHSYISNAQSRHFLALLILICSSLAILTKETAIVLPAALAIFPLLGKVSLSDRKFWISILACAAPVLCFIGLRISSIAASFDMQTAGGYAPELQGYSPSFKNVIDGLIVYFIYPFHVSIFEAGSWVRKSNISISLAFFSHIVILLLIWRTAGKRGLVGYICAYYLFLLPVLMIPIKGSHYLYASAAPLSVALAALLHQKNSRIANFVAMLAVIVLTIHSVSFQKIIYDTGTCMSRLSSSAEGAYLSSSSPSSIEFRAEPGSRESTLRRYIAHRHYLGSHGPIDLSFSAWDAPPSSSAASFLMNRSCIVIVQGN